MQNANFGENNHQQIIGGSKRNLAESFYKAVHSHNIILGLINVITLEVSIGECTMLLLTLSQLSMTSAKRFRLPGTPSIYFAR